MRCLVFRQHHYILQISSQSTLLLSGQVLKCKEASSFNDAVLEEKDSGRNPGDTVPGVEQDNIKVEDQVALLEKNFSGKFISKFGGGKQKFNRITWNEACKTGGTADFVAEQREKELLEMKELLKLPVVDGGNVLLLIQQVKVKYGPVGKEANIVTFWDSGSTCSLILKETAEQLECPSEPVTVTIETVNGEMVRDTRMY